MAPITPKSPFPVGTPTTTPIFCCNFLENVHDDDTKPFTGFKEAAERGIPTEEAWETIRGPYIQHVIEMPNPEDEMAHRYFAGIKPSGYYREIDFALFNNFVETTEVEHGGAVDLYCEKHKKSFQVWVWKQREELVQGWGKKKPELSPLQVGKEKLAILNRKTSYGQDKDEKENIKRR